MTAKKRIKSKVDANAGSVESTALLAVAPFTPDAYGGMKDADGDRVITCNDECPPCTLYKEPMVDADGWFMCPKCGRLGQRMEEASHRQVLTANISVSYDAERH
jgi:hypothetical protein